MAKRSSSRIICRTDVSFGTDLSRNKKRGRKSRRKRRRVMVRNRGGGGGGGGGSGGVGFCLALHIHIYIRASGTDCSGNKRAAIYLSACPE
jgi:hypothetical protein